MVFLIDGADFSDCIVEGGLEWQRNDIDGPNAGRNTMDGKAHRDRIAVKEKWKVSCMPLPQNRMQALMQALLPETFHVTIISPLRGLGTWEFYSNNIPATHLQTMDDGAEMWSAISFPIVEV